MNPLKTTVVLTLLILAQSIGTDFSNQDQLNVFLGGAIGETILAITLFAAHYNRN